ncbi:1-(5-phosphoribosyl)-5-[(5-phosphoribosylamino)methylideneamino] imidazole-4-carboxamide isomerase [Pyrenophora seminiperda CCB06]|uniref:1-(5-phosphoribosyl)-5-[(5-phosphoribosylamino)methylideneamino] imidazole-4-carboxamide isomerase n=1 Tax=Pyrenophora seminiperda CCB06 TaxID=1302712 RepID=A0A3M7M8X6_9PLEO|nr:1-(5-phosphoribosyl)-5-[(5-phosphoribosylamino)methylideneamino] imidazole-4-carboxamide isomerase [Pyrenophora seminiperda CCB06]
MGWVHTHTHAFIAAPRRTAPHRRPPSTSFNTNSLTLYAISITRDTANLGPWLAAPPPADKLTYLPPTNYPPRPPPVALAHHGQARCFRYERMDVGSSNVVMGGHEDPKDGNAVAGAVFGAVFIYIGFFVFCGLQAFLHMRESRRGAISLQ